MLSDDGPGRWWENYSHNKNKACTQSILVVDSKQSRNQHKRSF